MRRRGLSFLFGNRLHPGEEGGETEQGGEATKEGAMIHHPFGRGFPFKTIREERGSHETIGRKKKENRALCFPNRRKKKKDLCFILIILC